MTIRLMPRALSCDVTTQQTYRKMLDYFDLWINFFAEARNARKAHCYAEKRRQLQCQFEGRPYRYVPFSSRTNHLLDASKAAPGIILDL